MSRKILEQLSILIKCTSTPKVKPNLSRWTTTKKEFYKIPLNWKCRIFHSPNVHFNTTLDGNNTFETIHRHECRLYLHYRLRVGGTMIIGGWVYHNGSVNTNSIEKLDSTFIQSGNRNNSMRSLCPIRIHKHSLNFVFWISNTTNSSGSNGAPWSILCHQQLGRTHHWFQRGVLI